jgi:hypothetical protein
MTFPRMALVEQEFLDRSIPDIPGHIKAALSRSDAYTNLAPGSRLAIGVGSRGISNSATIVRAVVDFFRARDLKPFIFPAMGSHGAATAEGQADVLAHYGIDEASMGAPILSSLEVVSLGRTNEGIEVFMDQEAFNADGVFLVGRVKWHTDFSGAIESGLFKMMAIGLGKLAGARQYHTFAYRLGLEAVIRSVGAKILSTGKVIGGLAIQEGALHETAGLTVVSASGGADAMIKQEEQLLAETKTWMAKLPAPEIDVLIVDEMGKNISGAGMDTKVINRSVHGQYNPFPETPFVHRIFVRGLSSNTYHNGVGLGLADVVLDRLIDDIDWHPTYLNSLTASTPAAIRTPAHFASDRECLERIAPTVGKTDLGSVTYCRIQNTLSLKRAWVSENLIESLYRHVHVIADPIEIQFSEAGILDDAFATAHSEAPVLRSNA